MYVYENKALAMIANIGRRGWNVYYIVIGGHIIDLQGHSTIDLQAPTGRL